MANLRAVNETYQLDYNSQPRPAYVSLRIQPRTPDSDEPYNQLPAGEHHFISIYGDRLKLMGDDRVGLYLHRPRRLGRTLLPALRGAYQYRQTTLLHARLRFHRRRVGGGGGDAIHTQLRVHTSNPLWNTHLPSEIAPEPSLLRITHDSFHERHMITFMNDS